ncbi:AAA family ATPase [Belliella sp. DSM 111904]|uniref:AAA family ATPase n=1 Tax=Belliella filtrata TaxID=2923435 RepID=A0ABS9V0Y5_9BACT|nr:AAA family ATPase [Belliella filtrata]MCH7409993.1 AAA family ATPase [Belliella filtrata]
MKENILQLATLRVHCNGVTGTALLFFPGQQVEYVYVFTAKHCLAGDDFKFKFSNTDIKLEKIFNSTNKKFYSYQLKETDRVIASDDTNDLAVLVLSKQKILELTGLEFSYQIIEPNEETRDFIVRGFAYMNEQNEDRFFPLFFYEQTKDNDSKVIFKSKEVLDTYYQQAGVNMKGLSGAGIFSKVFENYYLVGIVQNFEEKNLFHGKKITVLNNLLIKANLEEILISKPETSTLVFETIKHIERNEIQLKSGISETIGTLNITRNTKEIEKILLRNKTAVIFGKPGVGKSAIAKSLISTLKQNNNVTVISFSSEQIACDSLEETNSKTGFKTEFQSILRSPAISSHVVIWIESFEKVIESNRLGAFKELIKACNQYSNVHLLITIRDYSLQSFRINLRFELSSGEIFYQLKEFNDAEMELVKKEFPEIKPLLKNHKIKNILRTPYYLDKAIRVLPELLVHDQLDEIGFKKLMWLHIVEKGESKRGEIFKSICVKRARELDLFTTSNKSHKVIGNLIKDGLLQTSPEEIERYSPSHDILEDWALTRYIQQKLISSTSPIEFLKSIENNPGIIRAFRIWLEDFYKNNPKSAIKMANSILADPSNDNNKVDVILIATLRSERSHVLLETLTEKFLKNRGEFLKKIILLLETGCMIQNFNSTSLNEFLPIGSGWDFVPKFIRENLKTVLSFPGFENIYISFLKSWSKQLPEFNVSQLPQSAKEVGELIVDYIFRHQFEYNDDLFKKLNDTILMPLLSILFSLTSALPETIKGLIDAAENIDVEHSKWKAKGLLKNIRHYLIRGVLSDQICKYYPDKVIKIAIDVWSKKEKSFGLGGLLSQIQTVPDLKDFGLNSNLNYMYDSPSGFQSFFYWHFLHHPELALDFWIPFLNQAFKNNYEARLLRQSEALIVSISFSDGSTKEYYGSSDYWIMYRGTNAINHLVSSLLMALEKGGLDLADSGEDNFSTLRKILERLIKESNSVSVLAVVSSIIQAYPELLDETSVSLLGVKEFYKWDSSRYSSESFTSNYYHNNLYLREERILENKRPHRKKYFLGLVGFVADYMFYHQTYNTLLFKEVDRMWESLDEGDNLMRKFLFDMDARKYNYRSLDQQGLGNMVQISPGYDDQIQEMVTKTGDSKLFFPALDSFWAKQVFDGEKVFDNDYESWKVRYQNCAREIKGLEFLNHSSAIAAVGIRDFLAELTKKEKLWCKNEIYSFGERLLCPTDPYSIPSISSFDKPGFLGLSLIFGILEKDSELKKFKKLIFRLLISNIDEQSKIYLELGLTEYLNKTHPNFVLQCWFGLLNYIENKQKEFENAKKIDPYNIYPVKKTENKDWIDKLIKSVVEGTFQPSNCLNLHFHKSIDSFVADTIRIIPKDSKIKLHAEFIQKVLQFHLDTLSKGDEYSEFEYGKSRQAIQFFYARYVLLQPQQTARKLFIELISNTLIENNTDDKFYRSVQMTQLSKAKFVYSLVEEFILAAAQGSPASNFWNLWKSLHEWIIENKRGYLINLFFLDIDWEKSVETWGILEGKNIFYEEFILNYGHNQVNSVIKLLKGIAFRNFMPDSISWIRKVLIHNELSDSPSKEVDFKLLEEFAIKAFYNFANIIKNQRLIINNFLFILDYLVEEGSTAAYLLREELIQYKTVD